jgi:hypothetical protein
LRAWATSSAAYICKNSPIYYILKAQYNVLK